MKKIIFYILFILSLIPFGAFAENQVHSIAYNGSFYPGCYDVDAKKMYGQGPSFLCQKYAIDGEPATCLDPDIPNPDYINEYYKLDSSNSFGKGLIAMANFAKANNVTETNQAHAYRIYTMKVNPIVGLVYGDIVPAIGLDAMIAYSSSDSIGNMVNAGLCASNGENCSGINIDNYLPFTSSSVDAGFSISKIDQETSSSGNYFNITANVRVNKSSQDLQLNVTGCKAKGLSCSIIKNNVNVDGTLQVRVSGRYSKETSVNVYINFKGTLSNYDKISEIELYTCNLKYGPCINVNIKDHEGRIPPYQRFIKLGSGNDITTESENYITIDIPSICDDPNLTEEQLLQNGCCDKIDGSKYPDDSKDQDNYIKYCGPIIHMENDCGKDSCNNDSYKAFSHSYVRLRNMKYMIEDLKSGGDVSDYLDYSINEYCGAYTTEKLDIMTPATAASVSGQFFVFDSYKNTDYSNININSYFRQPYIVERVKSTFFFNYNSWKTNYSNALNDEKSKYATWQSAVRNVGSTYKAYANVKDYDPYQNHRCQGELRYTNTCYNYVSAVEQQKRDTKSAYESALAAEPSARNAYRSAVTLRMKLQNLRDGCVTAAQGFSSSYKFDFDNNKPSLDFTYSQTSQKSGKTSNTVNMVDNTNPVKYWPNTTTNSSNGSYMGIGYLANGSEKVNISRSGVYLIDSTGNTGSYVFPSSGIDGCSGSKCSNYEYDGLAYSSIQGVSDAGDPYGENITITSPEQISKIYYFRPPNNTFALMNSGEYKTLNYESNAAHTNINGLEIGYVYNIELTTYKGSYNTSFAVSNYGYKTTSGKILIQELLKKFNMEKDFNLNEPLTSTCTYCNEEQAFKRNCDVCDPNDPTTYDFEPQFYYRSISLSDVTPNEREGETNWTDAKGTAAKTQIELGSGLANIATVKNNNEYVALANGNDYSKDGKISTYLADSSNVGKHDIYDDGTREYLEYEVTLTTKDMQMIKRNSSRSYFNYAKMNMCAGDPKNVKDVDEQYCFKCNSDMKECESSFVTSFFSDTTGRSKWKYYVNGQYCVGNIKTCIKGLDYTMVDSKGQAVTDLDGIYPDPLFPKQFLERYKNWP